MHPDRPAERLVLNLRKGSATALGLVAVAAAQALYWVALVRPADAQQTANRSQVSAPPSAKPLTDGDSLQEVLVTATKREESVQRIPIAVTAISGEDLENRNAINFDDYARSVPDLSFADLGNGRERIAIRGVDAKIGQAVVGYYFGETPIPDTSSVTAEKVAFDPEIVDIKRVEVLRGPQGTVFGSGSMGGTIRIIPNEPDTTKSALLVKSILSSTEHADGPKEVVSGVLNTPLINDRLALRVSTWASWDSGFIQRQVATPDSLAAHGVTGAPLAFQTVANAPAGNVFGARASLRLQANDAVTLTASLYSDQQYYSGFQDITTGPQNPDNALVQRFLFDQQETNRNRLTISNFALNADLGVADLLASVSYTRRLLSLNNEGAAGLESLGFVPMFSAAPSTEAGREDAYFGEARVSSKGVQAAGWNHVQWLAGASYGYQKGWTDISWMVPGFSQAFGALVGSVAGDNLYQARALGWIKQSALFGQLTYEPVDRLSLTAGARWYFYSRTDAQPQNGLFAGKPEDDSLPDPYTAPKIRGDANGVVYRGTVSWQQSQAVMYYAQASEGFRGPFGRSAIPDTCAAEAEQLGSTTAGGVVRSDRLWNYEIGAKTSWLAERLRANISLYRIDWTNVQQSVLLGCGFILRENIGGVVNKGAEAEIEARATDTLSGGIAVGYVESALQQNILGIPGTAGQPLPDVPKTTGGAFLSYDFGTLGSWSGSARADYSYTAASISAYGLGVSFAPDKGSLELLGAQLTFRRSNLELSLFGRNLLDRISRTALERDVTIVVPDRLRYAVNTPRTIGVSILYRQ